MSLPLLRSHIGWSAANAQACAGNKHAEFCNAKICQQQIKSLRIVPSDAYQEIGRFNILVHNLVVMRIVERCRRLLHYLLNTL